MWGGALPGTVRSLPVVVENRKEVVISSVRVQDEDSHDEDFLQFFLRTSTVSSTNLVSILISSASCVVGTFNVLCG